MTHPVFHIRKNFQTDSAPKQTPSDSAPEIFIITNFFCTSRYAFTPLIDDSDDDEIEFIASSNIGTVFNMKALKNCKYVVLFWYKPVSI